VADNVMVMYAGRQVERGTVDEIFYKSSHPYTQGLMQSLPRIEGDDQPLNPIGGQPPSMINLPSGCSFHPRCRFVRAGACIEDVPILRMVDEVTDHESSCHYAREFAAGSLEPTR